MKKMLSRVKQSNKGFTLIELIIVIAIIAVLAAVIAPQYIKYVEKSRETTDANTISEIAHAAEVAMVGDGATTPSNSTMTVTIASDSYGTITTGTLADAVNKVCPAGSYTFKSTLYKNATTITIVVTNGTADWYADASHMTAAPSKTTPTSAS